MIAWLIGLSGSGKSTLGRAVYDRLKPTAPALVFIDGDIMRGVWGDRLGHDIESRRLNAHRISHLCRMLDRQGISVIACVLSLFPEWQQWNREQFSSYFQVFLDISMGQLRARDPKAIYAAAAAGCMGNVVGVDIPFPRPVDSDLTISEEDEARGVAFCAGMITERLAPALAASQ